MSPEEAQVVIGEWFTALTTVHDELWEMDKDKLDDDTHESILKVTNIVNKLMRDMDALRWSDADRDRAFTLVAGYVTQSNVERQARRDKDLAKHKKMVEQAADRRIAESLRAFESRAREAEQRAKAATTASLAAIEYAASQVDVEIARRSLEIDARVE